MADIYYIFSLNYLYLAWSPLEVFQALVKNNFAVLMRRTPPLPASSYFWHVIPLSRSPGHAYWFWLRSSLLTCRIFSAQVLTLRKTVVRARVCSQASSFELGRCSSLRPGSMCAPGGNSMDVSSRTMIRALMGSCPHSVISVTLNVESPNSSSFFLQGCG